MGERAEVAPGSAVFGEVPDAEFWAGAPAQPVSPARGPARPERPENRRWWVALYAATGTAIAALPVVAVLVAAWLARPAVSGTASLTDAVVSALIRVPLGTLVAVLVLAGLVWAGTRLLAVGLRPGVHPIHGPQAWRAWATLRLLDEARSWLFPIYSSSLTPWWLRALGAKVGRDVEASTVLLVPSLTTVGEGAFLADDTLLGGYELGGGWLRVGEVKIGRHAFLGNSGMAAPGRKVPRGGLVAVLSAAPRRALAKQGTSWLGSPPQPLRRDAREVSDQSRTYRPTPRLRVARAFVEACRAVPVVVHAVLVVLVVAGLVWSAQVSFLLAAALAGPILMLGGAAAALITTAAKWVLLGRLRPGDHLLWSGFVWRNELADTFVEVLAAPWFARAATGTPALVWWLRSIGAHIGRGVWCETYWLPEADLVRLGDGSTVNNGCVVQTHLFHDRVLSMDTVAVRSGATLGPNSVILPAAVIGRHATVGAMSLVMRGELVPDGTRWIGNPIAPWPDRSGTGSR